MKNQQQDLEIVLSRKVKETIPFKKIVAWIEECMNETRKFKDLPEFFKGTFSKEGCLLTFDFDVQELKLKTVTIGFKEER